LVDLPRYLQRYLWEFQSTFEEVLDLAEEFKRRCGSALALSEDDFCTLAHEHSLSAARNRTGVSTAAVGPGASFVELCLAVYKKTAQDFTSPPAAEEGGVSPEDHARLKKAIEDYQKIQAEIAARDKKMLELEVGKGSAEGLWFDLCPVRAWSKRAESRD
jgi:hypothetical protein